jgi:hypothetical protein
VGGCQIEKSPSHITLTDIEWEFLGLDVPSITKSGGETWEGELAMSGQIYVSLRANGTLISGRAQLTVEPRNWGWGGSDWRFTPGGIPGGEQYL